MELEKVIKKLCKNNLLRTNEEIYLFEQALNTILDNKNSKDIKYLTLTFNDNTENDEVMFGLIHAIESYDNITDSKVNLKEFLETIPYVYPKAKEWIQTMIKRILNNEKCLNEYIEVAQTCNEYLKIFLVKIVLEKGALASQPTLSRFNNRLDVDSIKVLEQTNELLLDKIYKFSMLK